MFGLTVYWSFLNLRKHVTMNKPDYHLWDGRNQVFTGSRLVFTLKN